MPTTLLHVFPSFAIGGQQTRFATIANYLGPAFRHRVLSLDGHWEAAQLLENAVEFELVSPPQQRPHLSQRLRDIARACSKIRADVLVTYNWGAIEWALVNRWCRRRPHIHLEDGFNLDEANGQKPHRVLTRRFSLSGSKVLVPSQTLAKIACSQWKLRAENVAYVPNGLDPSRFDQLLSDGEPYFHRDLSAITIGSFSPLRPEKNIGRLLSTFAEFSKSNPTKARLVICGDGPERNRLQELAGTLGIIEWVNFVGHVAHPEGVMGAFDIFAMTSDTEQMPYAILEAMAARRAIVATAVGDIPVMVADENRRFVVNRDDSPQFVNALHQLASDAGLRKRLGLANRRRVERSFPIGQMAEAFRSAVGSVYR